MFRGRTPRELNKYAGVRHARPRAHLPSARKAPAMSTSFLGISERVRRSSSHDSIDWRNKDGKNWLQDVVEQGDCGSCYVISTVHMLTARNRFRHDDTSE